MNRLEYMEEHAGSVLLTVHAEICITESSLGHLSIDNAPTAPAREPKASCNKTRLEENKKQLPSDRTPWGNKNKRIYLLLLLIVQHIDQLDDVFVPQPP